MRGDPAPTTRYACAVVGRCAEESFRKVCRAGLHDLIGAEGVALPVLPKILICNRSLLEDVVDSYTP